MMRHRWLIQWKPVGKIADADFVVCARERSEYRQAMRIGDRLEKRGRLRKHLARDPLRRTTPLHRHTSILQNYIDRCQYNQKLP